MSINYRRKLWLNIMEDLGPPEGCVVPLWLRCVYTLLFPIQGLYALLQRAGHFDYLRLAWRIHGITYSDQLFARLAVANGEIYRFTTKSNIVTVERIYDLRLVAGEEVG